MKSTEPNQIIAESIGPFFRLHVHLLIAKGHEVARSRVNSECEEEDITGFIYKAIKDFLCRADCPEFFLDYDIHNEDPISDGIRSGRSRRDIDLTFVYTRKRGRPEYVIEAKPLNYKKSYQRESNYTNENALQRFLKGEYADYTSRFSEVAMVGYVMSDTPEIWKNRLWAAIDKQKAKLRLKSEQYSVQIVDELLFEWISEHDRESSVHPLTVCHILLDFNSASG